MSKVPKPVDVTYSNDEWALNVILDRFLNLALRTFYVTTFCPLRMSKESHPNIIPQHMIWI